MTASEADCQQAIIDAAMWAGWRVHHARAARPGRVLAIELKRRPNKPTGDQVVWLDLLRSGGIDARLVWVPDQMDALIKELTET